MKIRSGFVSNSSSSSFIVAFYSPLSEKELILKHNEFIAQMIVDWELDLSDPENVETMEFIKKISDKNIRLNRELLFTDVEDDCVEYFKELFETIGEIEYES